MMLKYVIPNTEDLLYNMRSIKGREIFYLWAVIEELRVDFRGEEWRWGHQLGGYCSSASENLWPLQPRNLYSIRDRAGNK